MPTIPQLLRQSAACLGAALFLCLLSTFAVTAQDANGPIEFDGKAYALAWTSQPSPNYAKQEYLPAGETPQNYSSMILIEVLASGAGVRDALSAQVGMLNERKASDPLVNMSVLQNEKTGEAILDFIVSSKDGEGAYIVEWNAYRYIPRDGGGVTLFGVSHRSYGNDEAKAFLTSLKTLRPEQINKLAQHKVPEARPAP